MSFVRRHGVKMLRLSALALCVSQAAFSSLAEARSLRYSLPSIEVHLDVLNRFQAAHERPPAPFADLPSQGYLPPSASSSLPPAPPPSLPMAAAPAPYSSSSYAAPAMVPAARSRASMRGDGSERIQMPRPPISVGASPRYLSPNMSPPADAGYAGAPAMASAPVEVSTTVPLAPLSTTQLPASLEVPSATPMTAPAAVEPAVPAPPASSDPASWQSYDSGPVASFGSRSSPAPMAPPPMAPSPMAPAPMASDVPPAALPADLSPAPAYAAPAYAPPAALPPASYAPVTSYSSAPARSYAAQREMATVPMPREVESRPDFFRSSAEPLSQGSPFTTPPATDSEPAKPATKAVDQKKSSKKTPKKQPPTDVAAAEKKDTSKPASEEVASITPPAAMPEVPAVVPDATPAPSPAATKEAATSKEKATPKAGAASSPQTIDQEWDSMFGANKSPLPELETAKPTPKAAAAQAAAAKSEQENLDDLFKDLPPAPEAPPATASKPASAPTVATPTTATTPAAPVAPSTPVANPPAAAPPSPAPAADAQPAALPELAGLDDPFTPPPIPDGPGPTATTKSDLPMPPPLPSTPKQDAPASSLDELIPPELRDAPVDKAFLESSAAPSSSVGGKIPEGTPSLQVPFSSTETSLPLSSENEIAAIATQLKADPNKRAVIVAYAAGGNDPMGGARRTSLSRASSIRSFLVEKGVDGKRISTQAMGDKVPSGSPDRADIYVK